MEELLISGVIASKKSVGFAKIHRRANMECDAEGELERLVCMCQGLQVALELDGSLIYIYTCIP